MELTIGPMDVGDLEMVLGWAADEGWNPGLDDAAAFHAADPGGFFLARMGEVPVAAVSVVNHSGSQAFLGLYLAHPEWRGRGIGFATWNHALGHAGPRSIGLDGVPAQEANYRASGFVRVGASLRHVGRLPGADTPEIRAFEACDHKHLARLDEAANGFTRARFTAAWLTETETRATRVLLQDGEIIGFATWRACREGTKIGPVIAPNTESALALIADIAALRPLGPLIVDLPELNVPLRRALEAQGFEVPFTTARMYRGAHPEPGPSLQAIATMELG